MKFFVDASHYPHTGFAAYCIVRIDEINQNHDVIFDTFNFNILNNNIAEAHAADRLIKLLNKKYRHYENEIEVFCDSHCAFNVLKKNKCIKLKVTKIKRNHNIAGKFLDRKTIKKQLRQKFYEFIFKNIEG